jgi:hypothetical protein
VLPSPEVKRAALRLQAELERFDFLLLMPHDWLHVTVPEPVGPAVLRYGRVNCFPAAVVVEVDGLAAGGTFLPHLTLALVTRAAPPHELREVLTSLRDVFLGEQRVAETIRVTFEIDRDVLFDQPYRIVDRA